MPKVPVIAPEVALHPAAAPDQRILPPAPGAFGEERAAAANRMGEAIQRAADLGSRAVTAVQQRDDEQRVLEQQTNFQAELQDRLTNPEADENGVPKGYLSRELGQAKGATLQFDQVAPQLKQKYLSSVVGPDQKVQMLKALDAHLTAARDQVIRHESQQRRLDFGNTLDSNIKANIASAATLSDPGAMANAVKVAQASAVGGMSHLGLDEATIKQNLDKVSGDMVQESVKAMLESHPQRAQLYFDSLKPLLSDAQQADVQKYVSTTLRQVEELAKYQQEQLYDAHMRTAMIDMFDGKLTLTEAERRFRSNDLKKSDYDILESKLVKPDYQILRQYEVSDPPTFNAIRQAQLSGSNTPGEITRMIAQGAAANKITPDDGKYLVAATKEIPPDPRDQQVQAEASAVRDFGNRYFAETNFLGRATNKEKTAQEVEGLLTEFYKGVDREKAAGDRIGEIANHVIGQFVKKRYPEINRLSDIPHVVVGIDGKVQRLLNPDQKTKLKGRFKLTPTSNQDTSEQ